MSYSLTDYSATEVEFSDGVNTYYYRKCYCSVELQGEYIQFTAHKIEKNAGLQYWNVAYTDFTTPTGSAATVLAAIKAIIESYAVSTPVYLVAHDENTQFPSLVNVGNAMAFDITDSSNDISIEGHSQITFNQTGVYNIQFSAQFTNNHNQAHDVDVWFKLNSSSIGWSSSRFTVPATHGGIAGHHIAAWNYMGTFYPSDYVEIYWQTTHIQVAIEQIPPSFDAPETPSTILTVDKL